MHGQLGARRSASQAITHRPPIRDASSTNAVSGAHHVECRKLNFQVKGICRHDTLKNRIDFSLFINI